MKEQVIRDLISIQLNKKGNPDKQYWIYDVYPDLKDLSLSEQINIIKDIPIKQFNLDSIHKFPSLIDRIENPSMELCQIAVRKAPNNLLKIEANMWLCAYALSCDIESIRYFPEEYQGTFLKILENSGFEVEVIKDESLIWEEGKKQYVFEKKISIKMNGKEQFSFQNNEFEWIRKSGRQSLP